MRGLPDAVSLSYWLCAGSLAWEVQTGSAGSPSMCGQEVLSTQDLLGKELKSEAGDFPSASESGCVHMRCTAVTTAKGPG